MGVMHRCRRYRLRCPVLTSCHARLCQIAEVNSKGVEYAERAIAIAPKQAGPHMACCVSKGRLALFSDNKTKVSAAGRHDRPDDMLASQATDVSHVQSASRGGMDWCSCTWILLASACREWSGVPNLSHGTPFHVGAAGQGGS